MVLMSKTYVVEHIKDIYEKGKLDGCSTCRDFRQVQQESQRLLNLEIFSIPQHDLLFRISELLKPKAKI